MGANGGSLRLPNYFTQRVVYNFIRLMSSLFVCSIPETILGKTA